MFLEQVPFQGWIDRHSLTSNINSKLFRWNFILFKGVQDFLTKNLNSKTTNLSKHKATLLTLFKKSISNKVSNIFNN